MASLFLMVGAVWAEAPQVGQRYRLKNAMTGLYMQANGSSNLQLQEKKFNVAQVFCIEDAGDGKFYLKSESGANKYVNASSWNAVTSDGANTPFTIELVAGETDLYTLDQQVSTYKGKIGADASTAGTSLYCNKGVGNNGKWQFEPVVNPEVWNFDPAKTYRIRSQYDGLYMQVMNYTTSGKTEGAFKLKDKNILAEGQKFMFKAATGEGNEGKFYLKTLKGTDPYYVNMGTWNFHAGTDPTTPFTIEQIEGFPGVYSIHQTVGTNTDHHGYAGNVNTGLTDGANIYCNQPSLNGNTVWSFEEVPAVDPNNITELTQFDNNSYYKVYGERGLIYGADDVVKGTNVRPQAYSEGNLNQHFAIIKNGDHYYLYNVGAKKFVVKSGNVTKLVDLPEQPITLEKTSDANYVWSIKLNGTHKMNLSNSGTDGVYTNYEKEDEGNRWLIYKTGTFDPAEALAAFDKVYVTVNYVFSFGKSATITQTATKGATFEVPNTTYPYTSVSSCTVGSDALTANNGVYSYTVPADASTASTITVTMNIVEELPFTVSQSYEKASWHLMRIRPVRNGNEEFNWVSKTENAPYATTTERPTTDAGLWAFVGNVVDGFKIYNKASSNTQTLGVDGDNVHDANVVMEDEETTWIVGKCVENGNLRGFYLYTGEGNKYAHHLSGSLKIWDSGSAPTDGGSAFLVYHPLTIKYMYEDEEVEDLKVDTYVAPGTVYTIDNKPEFAGKVVTSITVNDAALASGNSVTVNGVTNIVVTLEDVADKVYQLKAKHDGYFVYDDAAASNRLKPTATGDVNDYTQLWVMSASENGKFALRNASTRGYIKPGLTENAAWHTNKDFADLYIVLRTGAEGENPAYFNLTGVENAPVDSKVFLHCWGTTEGKGWTGDGGGSQFALVEVDGVTIATLVANTFNEELKPLIEEAEPLMTDEVLSGTEEFTTLNAALTVAKALEGSKDWDAVWDAVEPLTEALETAKAYIAANQPEETNLYALQSPSGTFFNFTELEVQEYTTQASFQSTPSFVYMTEENGSYVFQSLEDDTKYIGYQAGDGDWLTTTDKSYWTISEEDAEGFVAISRTGADSSNRLGSDENTDAKTPIYTNVSDNCNRWKLLRAYPVIINYVHKDSGASINVVKNGVIAGASFTAEIDNHGGTLVSCVADKGTMKENDGIISFRKVNAPITITVTLEGAIAPGTLRIDNWNVSYEPATNGIKLKEATIVDENGSGALEIPSTCTIGGKPQNVVAISPDFLHNNTNVTSVRFPSTLTNLGFRKVEPMFTGSYEGQHGDYGVFNGPTLVEGQGYNRCYIFPNDPHTGKPYVVNEKSAWRLTLDVTTTDPNADFNNYGSAIVSTYENSLANSYVGYMQIYMNSGHKNLTVKIDNADDSYRYTLPDGYNDHFKFELEHDGTGGYQVVIYYDDGSAKMYNISASANNTVKDFDRLYYSLPEGVHVDVKFDRLVSEGLFVGCTSLTEIIVDEGNPTFKSCEHGVLYDKNGYYVMRIPEGEKDHHFEIPSKVVKLYAGAVHGVKADIVLHSNPDIGKVEGHDEHVKNAKFYLSLYDIDPDKTVGGARDFISTNENTYQSANYKRAPLNEGMYGTICLPFAIEESNAIMQKYDFFKFKSGNATSLTFSQVTELEVNQPYLYKLKEGVASDYNVNNEDLDVFESTGAVTIEPKDKYDPTQHKAGTYDALGSFVNFYVETKNYPKSAFYYYSLGQKKFLKVTEKLTYRPYRAFFVVTPKDGEGGATKAPARLSLCLLDGTTTDIDASLVEGMETPVYYDLSGRRVLNPGSGVYIVNGKKVFIK